MEQVKRKVGAQIGHKHKALTRERIRTGYLLSRLNKHVAGEIELTATQVRSAEILLKKSLPDLSAIEHTGAIEHRNVREFSDAELLAILASSSDGAAHPEEGEGEPASLHRVLDS